MTSEEYEAKHEAANADPENFWRTEAQRIEWVHPFTQVKDASFEPENIHIRWFYDGTLNASHNCVDRHAKTQGGKTAIIWESDEGQTRTITYTELLEQVSRFANVLKNHNVQKGDRVTIYLPMVPEAAFAMLACARIGAVHTVVFGGFSPDALAGRILDSQSRVVITADEGVRGGKLVPLKNNVDQALIQCPDVATVLMVKRTGSNVPIVAGRDYWYEDEARDVSAECTPEEMNAEDPLFILYTSGSTGKPKGVLHTTGGYLVHASLTHQYVFDHRANDIYWCTADVGWVTGHSYIVYGPLCNGATTLMFEGVPTYPTSSRMWEIVDKHHVTTLYTAPTAIRALMREGDGPLKTTSRASLRILGSVGEPINPEAWRWYHEEVGGGRCDVVDTWWQTETGSILISPIPGVMKLKPGSATLPLFGIRAALYSPEGHKIEGSGEGMLAFTDSWPGQMRTLWRDHERFIQTYFSTFPGTYFSGDGCRRDEDGYYWITGRVDDVINTAGHRLGSAEIESVLVSHEAVAEAAVVACPHNIKGQGIFAYITLKVGHDGTEALAQELKAHVAAHLSPIARPDTIQFAPALPKTRSGKIMRRILRKIASGEHDLGDISTLADPHVVDELIATRPIL